MVGGWSGSSRNLRSLLVGVYRGDHLVHTGRVGTGFNQRNSGGLLKKLVALSTDKSPFSGKGAPRRAKDVTWVKPDGKELSDVDWRDVNSHSLGMLIDGAATDEVDERGHAVHGDTLLLIMNSGDAAQWPRVRFCG